MAKFELHYNQSASYDNKVEVDIRLENRPTKTDYQDMLDAIEALNKVAQKYVIVLPKETK